MAPNSNEVGDDSTAVHLTPPLVARLLQALYVLDDGDKIGLLFGRSDKRTKVEVEDNVASHSREILSIVVESFVCIGSPHRFIGATGELKKEALTPHLSGKEKEWLGWAVFRHNTQCRPSARERKAHTNLLTMHQQMNNSVDEPFVLCVLSSYLPYADELETRGMPDVYDYKFFSFQTGRGLVIVPTETHNLGQNGQNEYGNVVFQSPIEKLGKMVGAMGNFGTEIPSSDVKQLLSFFDLTHKKLEHTARDLELGDRALVESKARVDRLRALLSETEKTKTRPFVMAGSGPADSNGEEARFGIAAPPGPNAHVRVGGHDASQPGRGDPPPYDGSSPEKRDKGKGKMASPENVVLPSQLVADRKEDDLLLDI